MEINRYSAGRKSQDLGEGYSGAILRSVQNRSRFGNLDTYSERMLGRARFISKAAPFLIRNEYGDKLLQTTVGEHLATSDWLDREQCTLRIDQ